MLVGRSGWVARLTLNGENRGIYMRSSIFWLVEHEDDINLLPIIWLAPTWKTLVMTRCISKMLWCLFAVSYWRSGNGYLMLHEANVYSLLQSNTMAVLNPYVVFQAFAKARFCPVSQKVTMSYWSKINQQFIFNCTVVFPWVQSTGLVGLAVEPLKRLLRTLGVQLNPG